MRKSEKVFLVTGAGSGLGRALALALAQKGCTVILLGKTVRHLEFTDDLIQNARMLDPSVGDSYLYPLDLLNAAAADYETLAKTLAEKWGVLHGVVHQAGILGQFSPISHYPLKMWHEVIQVNLNAPFVLTRTLLPLLQKSTREPAHIVFSMKWGDDAPHAFYGAYGVSKMALAGFVQMLRLELSVSPHVLAHMVQLKKAVRTPFRLQGYPGESAEEQDWPEDAIPHYLHLLFPEEQVIS